MPVAFREKTITLDMDRGTFLSDEQSEIFVRQILDAVALKGFTLDYQNPEGDRSLNVIEVSLRNVRHTAHSVHFRVRCQLADKNFDDEYRGAVTVLVIAELA